MRSRRSVIAETRTKPIVLTGGLKEDISQIELKAGELIECVNYQEIDGIYHGYASIPGYEVFDGTALASSVLVTTLNDYGLDNNTSLLLEADLYEDKSINSHTVVNTGVVPDSTTFKFLGQSYQFNGIANLTVSPSNNSLDIG